MAKPSVDYIPAGGLVSRPDTAKRGRRKPVFVLPLKQVEDHGVQIGSFEVGFPIDPTKLAKIVDPHIDVLITTTAL
jgi:hypothetical protein